MNILLTHGFAIVLYALLAVYGLLIVLASVAIIGVIRSRSRSVPKFNPFVRQAHPTGAADSGSLPLLLLNPRMVTLL